MNPREVAEFIMAHLLYKDKNIVLPIVALAHKADLLPVVQELVTLEVADKFMSGYSSDLHAQCGYSERCQDFTSFYITDDKYHVGAIKRTFNPNYIVIVHDDGTVEISYARMSFPHIAMPSHTLRQKFLYLPVSKLVYGVMNKCGSTYIGKCLTNRNTEDAILARSAAILHMPEILSRTSDLYKFTVTRNPYTRLASIYMDIIAGLEETPPPRSAMYRRALKLPVTRRIEFAELITAIEEQGFIWGPGHEHWLPQVVISGYGYINYDAVGKLENLGNFLATNIEPILRRTIPTPEVIFPQRKDRFSGGNEICGQLYTDQLRNRVYRLYKIDFDVFDYRAALPKL